MKRKISEDEGLTETQSKIKKSDITNYGRQFRQKLKTVDALTYLRAFSEAGHELKVVQEYVDAGGSVKELLEILIRLDGKSNHDVAEVIFSAISCVVSKITSELLLLQKTTEETCDKLLSTYMKTLLDMLIGSSSKTSYRRVILRLFTAMVELNGNLARSILNSFPTNQKFYRILSSGSDKLRIQFIQFILSFLIDGNEVLSTELLQKKGLMYSIFPGLINDPPELIILVLKTLLKKVVDHAKISKTVKLHTFNTSVLRLIAKLLDYADSAPEDEKIGNITVSDLAFQLLRTLCTSHKLGILFHEQGSTVKKKNELILTLLEDLSECHKNELKVQLVLEILKKCPEFFKNVVEKLEPSFRNPDTEDIIKLNNFLIRVINEAIRYELNGATVHSTFTFINSIIFPPVLQNIFTKCFNDDVIHSHPVIRHQAILLLHNILKKINSVKTVYKTSHNSDQFVDNLGDQIEQFLIKIVIPIRKLTNAWKVGVDCVQQEYIPNQSDATLDDYFLTFTELLLSYKNVLPISFNELRSCENMDFYEKALTTDNEKLKFNLAILLFYVHNPKPSELKFEVMMEQLICFFIQRDDSEVNTIIKDVLKGTGFFERFEDEMNVWLCCMKKSRNNVKLIVDLFVKSLRTSAFNNKKYLKIINTIGANAPSIKGLFENGCDYDLPKEIENSGDVNNLSEIISKQNIAISPLFLAFIDVLSESVGNQLLKDEKKTVKKFYSSLVLGLFHLQYHAKPISDLLTEHNKNNLLVREVLPFISFWIEEGKKRRSDFEYPDCPADRESLEAIYYSNIVNGSSIYPDNLHVNTQEQLVLLWNLVIFYVTHDHVLPSSNIDTITRHRIDMLQNIFSCLIPENKYMCMKFLLTNYYFIDNYLTAKKSGGYNVLFNVAILSSADLSSLKSPFRYKFLKTVLFRLTNKMPLKSNDELTQVQFLQLSNSTIIYLLSGIINLPVQLFMNGKTNGTTMWIELMVSLLHETIKRFKPLDHNILIILLEKIIEIFKRKVTCDHLEDAIDSYFCLFSHHINQVSEDLINDLLFHGRKSGKYTIAIRLICTRSILSCPLQVQLLNSINKSETFEAEKLIRILNFAKLSEITVQELLKYVWKSHFKNVIILLMDPNCLWFKQNALKWTEKVLNQMDDDDCVKICDEISENWSKLNFTSQICSVILIIFKKSSKTEQLIHKLLLKFCQTSNENISDWLIDAIGNAISSLEDLRFLQSLSFWKNFIRASLKISLQNDNVAILHNFRIICEKGLDEESKENVGLIFQMTISHSEFVNRMINESNVKCELIQLLLALTSFDTTVMSSNHLPLLLASYKAILKKSDQYLLELLRRYEESGVRFLDCRPYLWGQAAANHHSIKNEISVSLKRHPSANQVLELLDINIIKNTVKYYPLSRPLQPNVCEYSLNNDIYDLCFILPVISHVLAPESRLSVQKFTRSGALCLMLTSLSCEDEEMRIAGYHCFQRFHSHLFSQEKEVQIWKQFTEALKNGLNADHNNTDEKEIPRLPCLVTTFLSYMSLIISEPLHYLYSTLLNYLLAKPCFDLASIPNFFILFFSNDLKHREHQEWILKVIRDGMRYKKDWLIAQKSFLFKFLQQYYLSSLSNRTVNLLILQILMKALEIDKCKELLITKCGLFSWISQVLRHDTNNNQLHHLPIILKLLGLSITAKNSKAVLFLAIFLARKLKFANIEEANLRDFLQIVLEAYRACKRKDVLEKKDIKLFIDLANPFIDQRSRTVLEINLKFNSSLGLDEFCDSNAITISIVQILRIFVKLLER